MLRTVKISWMLLALSCRGAPSCPPVVEQPRPSPVVVVQKPLPCPLPSDPDDVDVAGVYMTGSGLLVPVAVWKAILKRDLDWQEISRKARHCPK
jgi:hypothetical protein